MGLVLGKIFVEAGAPPLYLQLQRVINDAINAGQLKAEDSLPSERYLADYFGISRVTVRRAIAVLVGKGLLVQKRGSGTFISGSLHFDMPLSKLSSFTEDSLARDLKPTSRVTDRSIGVASAAEAEVLKLPPDTRVVRLRRLRLAGGVPMAIEQAVVPGSFLPDPNLVQGSLYALLTSRGFAPRRAIQRLHAVLLEPYQALELEVPPGSPALYIERRTFLSDGRPIEFTSSFYRGDAYDFVAELSISVESEL